jgi:hypothetical protein
MQAFLKIQYHHDICDIPGKYARFIWDTDP